jgi:FkbM family methyltransferase
MSNSSSFPLFSLVERVETFIHRKRRARKLGIRFHGAKTFVVPEAIVLGRQRIHISVPDEDAVRGTFVGIFLDDCYGLELLDSSTQTVLDIGAHVGFFSLAARGFFPSATIHAYEPNPMLAPYLKAHSESADFRYFTEALGREDGKADLAVHGHSGLTRTVTRATGNIAQIAFAKVIDRIGGEVDLVKLDCEGAEWNFLDDLKSWEAVRNLSLEYHLWPTHSHGEIRKVIAGLGFTVNCQRIIDEQNGWIYARRLRA